MSTLTQTGGVGVASQTEEWTPDLDFAGPDDPDFFGGEGPSTCMWEDGFCTEIAEYYIMEYCNDPDCKYDHAMRYCPRHFVVALGLKLDHLAVCPGMREAATPEEIKSVAFQHLPSFGPLSKDPDRASGAVDASGSASAPATEVGQMQVDDVIDRLRVHFCRGAYSDLRMTEHTTIGDLRAWIDELELSHLELSVELFSAQHGSMKLQETRYEADREKPYSVSLYSPDDDEPWSPATAVSLERHDLIMPKLCTRVDENGELIYYYTSDTMLLEPMRDLRLLTQSEEDAQPGLFAIVEGRTGTVIPVTNGSWLQWKVMFDGDENELSVRDDVSFRKRVAPYVEYLDTTTELNPVKVRAKIAELMARANRVLRDGVLDK